MIIMFVITYAVYGKNKMLGALLETVMGVAMLTYILVSIVTLFIQQC